MEEVIINDRQIQLIADRTAEVILRRLKPEPDPVYVSVKEAARLMGVSVSHMYKIKDEFSYIRRGEDHNGHIYFLREGLITALAAEKEKLSKT